MTLNEICDLAEIIQILGISSSISDADRAMVSSLKGRVENGVRRFLGHNVSQPTTAYVHYLPNKPMPSTDDDYDTIELLASGKVAFGGSGQYGDVLQLPQLWLRSIVEIREDLDALGGGGASIFTSDDLLTENVDYRADWDEPGMCRAGQIIRIGRSWPAVPRCVRVISVCGLTAAELDDEYSDIKDVVIEETVTRFNMSKSRSATTGGVGPIKSESLGGEYSVTYDTSERFLAAAGNLSQDAKEKLERFLNLNF